MTQYRSEPPPTPGGGTTPTGDVAREQAAQVGGTAVDAGRHVAGTAKEQAGQVAEQARREAGDLYRQAREQVTEQARGGQRKAGDVLRSLAAELHEMAGGEHTGPASDLAAQAAGRVDDLAGWLDQREPGDLVGELRSFARRRPGAFLAGAALAGVLAGRLTRGVVDANRDTGPSGPTGPSALPAATPGYQPAATPAYQVPPVSPLPYNQPYHQPYDQPGSALPPGGPLDAPVSPGAGQPVYPTGGPLPGGPPPVPGHVPAGPVPDPYPRDQDPYYSDATATQPLHGDPALERPEGTSVGEYVEELDRSEHGRRNPDGPR